MFFSGPTEPRHWNRTEWSLLRETRGEREGPPTDQGFELGVFSVWVWVHEVRTRQGVKPSHHAICVSVVDGHCDC